MCNDNILSLSEEYIMMETGAHPRDLKLASSAPVYVGKYYPGTLDPWIFTLYPIPLKGKMWQCMHTLRTKYYENIIIFSIGVVSFSREVGGREGGRE